MIQNLLASPSASTHTPIQKKQPLLHKKAFIKGLSFSILILSAMASAAHQLETFSGLCVYVCTTAVDFISFELAVIHFNIFLALDLLLPGAIVSSCLPFI